MSSDPTAGAIPPPPAPEEPGAADLAHLERALRDAERRGAVDTSAESRNAVVACVDVLKRWGDPPERVVVKIKSAIARALPPARTRPTGDRSAPVVAQIVRWSIEAYFRAPE